MNLYLNELYLNDVRFVSGFDLPWQKLTNKSIMLSGATGLLGSFLVDVILEKDLTSDLNCTVYALGRDEQKAKVRFSKFSEDKHLIFIPYDVKNSFVRNDIGTVDYVLHLASNTHPMQYSTDPIGTITTNIIGLQNMLDFAIDHHATRFAFASSNEIYGENRGDVEFFDEAYCGYINSNTMRAGYPESKRCGEALCQAYKVQMGLDVVIPRFTRSYGPTMLMSDTKAISQFIKKGIAGEATALLRISREIGLVKNLSAPLSMHLFWLSSSAEDVSRITGMWFVPGFFFIFSQRSAPSILSMTRSVITASGMLVDIFAHASLPFEYTSTLYMLCNSCLRYALISLSSSTRIMFFLVLFTLA